MDVPKSKDGFSWGATRELLLPLTLLVCFALYYLGGQPFWVVLACALPMLGVYALAPSWSRRSALAFDRDAVALLAAGRPEQLRGRYARSLGMRLFAPPAVRAERKALVLAENGDARGARDAYKEALDEHAGRAPLRVMLGYAHASFALRDDENAIPVYRTLLKRHAALPGVERKLAHALVRRGEDLQAALTLIARSEREPADPARQAELTLLKALAHAKLADRTRARELLEIALGMGQGSGELRDAVLQALDAEPVAAVPVRAAPPRD